ncbi:hypothetical protein CN689_23270 [Peribacillus butanolivorans]|uniref:Uncharacterized protein n=1 Tax=Peribacillus butanolivorans TaxID=421767 RepID=A0AAX0RWG6_9BACI|nr:hypothetical protein [Peribacillus butanolivorans]AXN40730.1 hypothetical protein DTO10_21685 [Peribacillus butanolivorans]PEJ27712.1 hypothetical protein CN689_23270 [Peribacillus butanolivorans]
MEWLKPFEANNQFEDNTNSLLDFKIREYIPESNIQKKYSLLTQFFLLLGSQDDNSVTSLFVDNRIDNQVIEEIIMHFDNTKIVLENELPSEIMLSKPNQESLSLIRSNNLNPIIKNLYGTINNTQYEWRPQKSYKILSEFIEKYEDMEFDEVLDCLKNTSQGSIISLPLSSWTLEDSLKDTFAIRYFTHKCKNVYLWIDDANIVTTIQLELN